MQIETKPFTMAISWNNNEEGWPFPVLPGKVTIKREGSGRDYRIIGLGPIRSNEKPGLAEISFESFFPGQNYPFSGPIRYFYEDGRPKPNQYVNDINKWMHSGYPVRFVYVGADSENKEYKIFLPMTITSFERWEEAGSPGDIFYRLELKEYVFYAPRRARPVQQPDGSVKLVKDPPKRWDPRVPKETYTIQPGDNLVKIAMKELNDSSRWREIQKLNNLTDADLKRLQVGQVLKLPKRE
jgi:hypothetical protein